MTPAEATALMAFASQLDGRVQVNEANAETWAYGLARLDYAQARWEIREYYAMTDAATPITPGVLRRRVAVQKERAEARRQALAGPKQDKPGRLSERNPGLWNTIKTVTGGRSEL